MQGDTKGTWKVLKELINKSNHKAACNSSFKYKDSVINDKKEVSNKFNEFYVNVGPSLAKKIPTVNNDPLEYLNGSYNNSLFLNPVVEEEVYKIIMNIKNNKANGYDDISINIVKKVVHCILYPQTKIANMSFSQGIFPNCLKHAKVVPVYKAGDVDIFSNYRPVSVLPVFSKVLERLFHVRLYKYVESNNILYDGQYGFREKYSTLLALLDFTEQLTKSFDSRNITVGIFI